MKIDQQRNEEYGSTPVAPMGTAMLSKYTKMTPQIASSNGKEGRADLHMHSTYSDGSTTIEQMLDYVENQTNLDVIALTDHDVIEGALRARELWSKGNYRFDFVVGEEISTREGHLLALFIEERIPPRLSMEESIDRIHAQGGLAVVAHPLHRFFRHSCQKHVLDRIMASDSVWLDGMESWNASFCGIYANYIAMSANRTIYGLPELGNSDSHSPTAIGSGFTWFEGKTAEDIRNSISKGLTAPGGKMWDVQSYYTWISYLMKKNVRLPRRLQIA